MAKTTPTRGSDQHCAAAAGDREHSEPSSTERARAINAARFGESYTAALQAKPRSSLSTAVDRTPSAISSAPTRPPVTNKNLPNMSRQMSSRHRLLNGRSRTGFNTPAEVQEAQESAFRKFPVKAHAHELAAREAKEAEKVTMTTHRSETEEVVEVHTAQQEVAEMLAEDERKSVRGKQDEGGEDDSDYDSDA